MANQARRMRTEPEEKRVPTFGGAERAEVVVEGGKGRPWVWPWPWLWGILSGEADDAPRPGVSARGGAGAVKTLPAREAS